MARDLELGIDGRVTQSLHPQVWLRWKTTTATPRGTREAYEIFRQDLNYSCTIFTGQPVPMAACVREVAADIARAVSLGRRGM